MKLFKRSFLMLPVFLLFACGGTSKIEKSAEMVRIFYFPFYLETFHPITLDNIEEKAMCKFSISVEEADKILRIFDAASPGEFDNQRVRLKISGLKNIVFLDADGGLPLDSDNGKSMSLDAKDFQALETLIEAFDGANDCRREPSGEKT